MEAAALGLRVDGVDGIDRASSSLDRFTKSSKSADEASGGLAAESRNTSKSLADVAKEGDKSSTSMSKLAGAAKLAAGAFAGIKLTALIKDATMAHSRFDQLGLVMDVVGRNASLSQDQVNAYAKEVEAMGISMTESRQTVIGMISAQMDLTKASELARLAQDAAVVANTNSSDALGRLINGLQTGNTLILRNMGLNVNFTKSYEELAKQLGVTADQLSEVDKVQARTNAVMAAGAQIAGAYEASMENAGKQLGSTTRYLQDLGVMWGEVFSDAAREAIFGYSDALKDIHTTTKQMSEDGTLAQWSENIAKAMRSAADVVAIAAFAIGSRLVVAAGASAAAFAAARIEAIRYQFALARMTGVSTTAAVRLTALSYAARGASAAMALVGGPAGAALLAAGAIYYFATRASEAERESKALDSRINKLNGSFNKLNADQAAAAILDYDAKLASATRSMQTAEARVFTLSKNLREFPNSKKADEWATDLVRAKGSVADAADEVNKLNAILAQLNGIVQSGGAKELSDDTETLTDTVTELTDAQKALATALDQTLAGYHRQLNLAKDATESEQLLYEIQHGRLQGLLPAQQKTLEGMAKELDMRNKLAQAEADQKDINRERDDIDRKSVV